MGQKLLGKGGETEREAHKPLFLGKYAEKEQKQHTEKEKKPTKK